jgi:DNA-binding transcriptional regulator YhcF (GntR family)
MDVSPTAADPDPLGIALDRDADVPLGVQLAWALRARIESGALAPGARLPGLHQLAGELSVNANTVRAVYQRLEQEGLVATRHGSGTFVTGAGGERRAVTELATDAARAAREAGITPRELAAALYVGGDAPPPADEEAAARRRLREQIAALEQAYAELVPPKLPSRQPGSGSSAAPQPRLLGAAELEQRRDELLRQLAKAQRRRPQPPSAGASDASPATTPARARRRTPARAPKLRPT